MAFCREAIAGVLPAYDNWVAGTEALASVEGAFGEVTEAVKEIRATFTAAGVVPVEAGAPAWTDRLSDIAYDLDGGDVMDVARTVRGRCMRTAFARTADPRLRPVVASPGGPTEAENSALILDSVRASLNKRVSNALCFLSFLAACANRKVRPPPLPPTRAAV